MFDRGENGDTFKMVELSQAKSAADLDGLFAREFF